MKNIFLLLNFLSISAFGGMSKDIVITGTLRSVDDTSITIRDSKSHLWKIPRKLLLQGYPLTTGQEIKVRVAPKDAEQVREKT